VAEAVAVANAKLKAQLGQAVRIAFTLRPQVRECVYGVAARNFSGDGVAGQSFASEFERVGKNTPVCGV